MRINLIYILQHGTVLNLHDQSACILSRMIRPVAKKTYDLLQLKKEKKLEFWCICEKYGFSNKVINTTWKFLSPWLHFVLQCRIQSSLHHYRTAAYIGWPTDSSRIFPVWLRPLLPCNEWEDRSVSTGFDHSCGKTKHLAEGKVKAQLNKC